MAVRGQSYVEKLAGGRTQSGQILDELDEAIAEKGFPASEANLFDTKANEDFDEPEVVCDREFRVLRAVFTSAAVDALVIAAISDGDAEVMDDAAVAVHQAAYG